MDGYRFAMDPQARSTKTGSWFSCFTKCLSCIQTTAMSLGAFVAGGSALEEPRSQRVRRSRSQYCDFPPARW
jgi:hypothetical protein